MTQWRKLGHVFTPDPDSWMHSYSQVPTPVLLEDRIRVFFGCRPRHGLDELPISQIGFVDLDRDEPLRVIETSTQPVLDLGEPGTFDEFGLHPLSAVRRDNQIWLYYVGWTRMTSVPFNRAIGLAISENNGLSFHRVGRGPVVGATLNEPYLQQGPTVRKIGDTWHMWYLSGTDWIEHDGRFEAIYQMMHATSDDGINWNRNGIPCLPTVVENECQAGQGIIERDGTFHMWFSFRPGIEFRNAERGYRMGYAKSQDLETWVRDDELAGIDVSQSGWDSEMVCYPNIVEFNGRSIMFYCGNYFGRDGFGCAELISLSS